MVSILKLYPKINSVFKRDSKTKKFIIGEFSCPEFEYLVDNKWYCTEKIDGTNVRIIWDNNEVEIKGRTDNAIFPAHLMNTLVKIFLSDKFIDYCMENFKDRRVIFFGEGYGYKIQKAGHHYCPNGTTDFILFDIFVGNQYWLNRYSLEDIADKLDLKIVPDYPLMTLYDAINMVIEGFESNLVTDGFIAEGIVAIPATSLLNRYGGRIITKIKYCDFTRRAFF